MNSLRDNPKEIRPPYCTKLAPFVLAQLKTYNKKYIAIDHYVAMLASALNNPTLVCRPQISYF